MALWREDMLLNKCVRIEDLYECHTAYLCDLFTGREYPWEILPVIKRYILHLIEKGLGDFSLLSDGILVGENVRIHPNAVIESPAVLGRGTEIRTGAYLRGSVITGEGCVIGNSTEIKNSVLLNGVQLPHYNYVGDSILGNKAHLGAGAVCSNLKADGKDVVIHGERAFETGLRKVGGFLGDGADIGCGCVVNPGTVVGKKTSVYPLTFLRGVYPGGHIVKNNGETVERR